MNVRIYIFTLFLCVSATSAVSAQEASWSTDTAKQDAAQAIENNKLFLYSSGGFVCYPKADNAYKELIKLLPVESLACGCVISNISKEFSQMEYAREFNNTILEYISKNPAALEKQKNTNPKGFSSYLESIMPSSERKVTSKFN
jgi:hypothetical protein